MTEEKDSRPEIEQSAIQLLTSREHSRKELSAKLLRRFSEIDLVAEVLSDMEKRGLLSDERFTENYVDQRRRKGFGPRRIRSELRDRGVGQEEIDNWLDERDGDWYEEMKRVATGKFGDLPPKDQKDMAKRARFLEYRGFPPDLIRQFLWND